MARKGRVERPEPVVVEGAAMLRRVFPLLQRLASAGTERDKAGNRRLRYSQYAALVLVGLFNPVLQSARALVAASGLKAVRRLAGGRKVSLGAFSEATAVFDPRLLDGLVKNLRQQVQDQGHRRRMTGARQQIPDALLERLVAVDSSVLSALPQIVSRLGRPHRGQWRLHAEFRVVDGTLAAATLTQEPAVAERSERAVVAKRRQDASGEHPRQAGDLLLLDRGYRSAKLFNDLHRAGDDYVCRLMWNDGAAVSSPVVGPDGRPRELPALTNAAREAGVVADEWIVLGGSGASSTRTDHLVRRITVIPPADRPSSARQGRVRSDQGGKDELVLATTLLDLPAELIVLLYECRWQVELFFRFLKHALKCEHLLSAKTAGVQIQLYCALIASLLIALATGGNLTRRNYEMICLFLAGWADEEELLAALQKPP